MTNIGTIVHISPFTMVRVCGTLNNTANGQISVQDSATLHVDGTANISSGTLSFSERSTGLIKTDLLTAGICGTPSSFVVRAGSGDLRINGNLVNKGSVTNSSRIIIDQNMTNEGILTNSKTILVGGP